MWILIIFWVSQPEHMTVMPPYSPIAISNIEFHTLDRCMAAQTTLMKAEIPGNKFYLCAKK